jgi:hypothetical protein
MASKLDRWIASFSRHTIATVVIAGGILFFIISSPPRTLCDTQIEYFTSQQNGFLFKDPNDKLKTRPPDFARMHEYCEQGNGPGACYELFARLRRMNGDLDAIPPECESAAGKISELRKALWGAQEILVRAGWGAKPPQAYQEKFGWLDTADVALFCALKTQLVRFAGQGEWDQYQEKLFHELPGAKDLPRKEAWEKMLVSEDCRRYR